ncbi:MAG: YigZ family protein [Synergistaceae bacterium]|nr:YigZ family protein [Synergistaceae bacterium]MBQ7169689.1 YigZ family protein [Synergistaceae bacterium]
MPLEPASPSTFEAKIKRSVFIADVFPCRDEEEARSILAQVTTKYRDATHNCRAYVLADGTEYSSDDGEPSGTAGRPILGAIKRSGLVNVMVVVTRYYGGVKLGVRGLIEAYGETATKALELCGRVERVMMSAFTVSMGYNSVGNVARLLEGHGASGLSWDYGEAVRVAFSVPADEADALSSELDGMMARGIVAEWERVS